MVNSEISRDQFGDDTDSLFEGGGHFAVEWLLYKTKLYPSIVRKNLGIAYKDLDREGELFVHARTSYAIHQSEWYAQAAEGAGTVDEYIADSLTRSSQGLPTRYKEWVLVNEPRQDVIEGVVACVR